MKKKKILWITIILALLVIVAAAVLLLPKIKSYLPYYFDMMGLRQKDISYTLTIDKEDFENEVALKLQDNKVIYSATRFLNYLKSHYPDFVWYNGIYYLNANMSYRELCAALKSPNIPINYAKIVIPEGRTVKEIAAIVAQSGLCSEADFLAAADSYDYDYSFIEELKNRDQNLIGYKLEGYLFPATYEFREDTVTPHEMVDKMLSTFASYITDDLIAGAKAQGLSLNQLITFGSVVQAEGLDQESMENVASVFWNRLHSKSLKQLQSDPTKEYAQSLKTLQSFSVAMSNAYDTYSCTGLPVAPTNCPGIEAISAVIHPASTNYYYFVTDKNKNFYYNQTLEEHNETIRSLKNQNLW